MCELPPGHIKLANDRRAVVRSPLFNGVMGIVWSFWEDEWAGRLWESPRVPGWCTADLGLSHIPQRAAGHLVETVPPPFIDQTRCAGLVMTIGGFCHKSR